MSNIGWVIYSREDAEKNKGFIRMLKEDFDQYNVELKLVILEEIDNQVYIKVPVSYEGVKAIKILKSEGINVTATAVYDLMQAYMALAAGADYIAPYVNRIGNLGSDPMELINELSSRIVMDGYKTKIVAASFKGVQQVRDSFNYGAHAITAPVDVLKTIFKNPSIEKAVDDFNSDWYAMYGEGTGICDL